MYDGVDVTVNARLPRGRVVQGGLSTGRELFDNCDVVGKVDNAAATLPTASARLLASNLSGMASPSARFCRVAPLFLTQVKFLGVYPLPWWGLQTSATLQSIPGPEITALYVAPNAARRAVAGPQPGGGRRRHGHRATDRTRHAVREAAEPGRLPREQDRHTWVATRMQASVDIYNLFNASPILALNTRYGPSWLRPTAILPARFAKFSLQMDF